MLILHMHKDLRKPAQLVSWSLSLQIQVDQKMFALLVQD